ASARRLAWASPAHARRTRWLVVVTRYRRRLFFYRGCLSPGPDAPIVGYLHGISGLVAIFGSPIAFTLIGGSLLSSEPEFPLSRLRWATLLAWGGFGLFLASLTVIRLMGQMIFDTVSDSEKHQKLQRDTRIAATLSGPGEQTLQLEGRAHPVSAAAESDALYRQAYYSAWPDGRERQAWPKIAYWRIEPQWARYSDYERGPLIVEFDFA